MQQTKLPVERISIESKIPVVVPKKVRNKITYLCQVIPNIEWSGVLFYEVHGSIKNFGDMKIVLKDVYPMDVGDAASTGFEHDEKLVEYRMNNPKSFGHKIGMIHSHHNMQSYFSSTDMDELVENSEFHNYYLSLVVNNVGDMVARIGFRLKENSFTAKDEQGEDFNLSIRRKKITFAYLTCEVDCTKSYIKVDAEFSERTKEILEDSKKRKEKHFEAIKNIPPIKNGIANDVDFFGTNDKLDLNNVEPEYLHPFLSNLFGVKCLPTHNVSEGDVLRSSKVLCSNKDYKQVADSILAKFPEVFNAFWTNTSVDITVDFVEEVTLEVLEFCYVQSSSRIQTEFYEYLSELLEGFLRSLVNEQEPLIPLM